MRKKQKGNGGHSTPHAQTDAGKEKGKGGHFLEKHTGDCGPTGCWLLAAGYWLLVAGCWLLVTGYWLLVAGCWLPWTGGWYKDHWLLVVGCGLVAGYLESRRVHFLRPLESLKLP